MRTITIPTSVVALRSDRPLTPAMVSAVWEIAGALDEARTPAEARNSVWLEVPTSRLRGEGSRSDNTWLRECLDRLTGVKLSGEHKGDPWGAVVIAEWHIEQGGTVARLLVPPAGVHALRAPANFTKIESHAAHRLTGHARRLYVILADKKRLGRPFWRFDLDELRALLGVDDKRSYDRFNNFRQYVLDPAISGINDYGTVAVKVTPERQGRAVKWVRFDWKWKDPHEASDTTSENERHSAARRRGQQAVDAPPMIEEKPKEDVALVWWQNLSDAEQNEWTEKVGRTFKVGEMIVPRRGADIARAAYGAAQGAPE